MAAHENLEHRNIRRSSDRGFGLVFASFFLIVALLPVFWSARPYWWALTASIAFLTAAMLVPAILGPLNRLWFRFGLLLHVVVSPIVLGIMFYGVVVPTGLIMRALGKDPLRLRFDRDTQSYWIKRDPPGPPADSFRDQF